MSKPTLLVLAAGMGSRYGGLKQMDGMGPDGQLLIEYSVYDASRAGFGRVVFVVREELEADFREIVSSRFANAIPVDFCHQRLGDLPPRFQRPAERQKPWGTGHAILAARDIIDEPFCVINGDDFYGQDAFMQMGKFLSQDVSDTHFAMVGYQLANTLSEHGHVSRGVCDVDAEGHLKTVIERTRIAKSGATITYTEDDGSVLELPGNASVSLNFWGFSPDFFDAASFQFVDFLQTHLETPKAEFYAPAIVDNLIRQNKVTVKVLPTNDRWFGVTYSADKPIVQENLQALIKDGTYPRYLWT